MQFEHWLDYVSRYKCVTSQSGKKCEICGKDYTNSKQKDITTIETHSRFRDTDIQFSLCWNCQEDYMDQFPKIQDLLARAIKSTYWRCQKVNVRKRIFRMKIIQDMYQRGRDEVRAMEKT